MVDERYFTVQEACELLNVDDETILAWIHSGELTAVNISKLKNGKRPTWRIPKTALRNLLKSRQNREDEALEPKTSAKRTRKP